MLPELIHIHLSERIVHAAADFLRLDTEVFRRESNIILNDVCDDLVIGILKTMPTVRRISRSLSSSAVLIPSTSTSPSVGVRMAFKCFASVLLPEPLWPSTATKLPFSISMLTPQRLSVSSPG